MYYNAWVSLAGAVFCLVVMFLCDVVVALVVILVSFALYLYVAYRKPEVNWGSTTQAQTYVSALKYMQSLSQVKEHVKNYRPQVLVLAGRPSARPLLVDFGYALTKNLALMVVGNVMTDRMSMRARSHLYQRSCSWLVQHHVRAFYTQVEAETFDSGAKALMQLTGLGNLRPNMVLLGYKSSWRACNKLALRQYVSCIHDTFDSYLGLAILRVGDSLDLSNLTQEDLQQQQQQQRADISRNQSSAHLPGEMSGSEASSTPNTPRPPRAAATTLRPAPVPEESNCGRDGPDSNRHKVQYLGPDGEPLSPSMVETLTQFRRKQPNGFIDVWWLYDDGGLTLLLPYILTTRKKWGACKLRVFTLANKRDELDMEQRTMAALLSKFRIDYSDVIVIGDVTKQPEPKTREEFNGLIADFRKPEDEDDDEGDELRITESELLANKDKTSRHLRLHELVQEHSRNATLVVMTLPMPRRGTVHAPLYMAWLEMMTKDMPPFLMIRGNQTSVLTFYM